MEPGSIKAASSAPVNDTCTAPVSVEFGAEPTVLAGTTEDAMGKIKASDQNSGTCGGAGGADAVYRLDLAERSLVNAAAIAAFPVRLYLRSGDCGSGEQQNHDKTFNHLQMTATVSV